MPTTTPYQEFLAERDEILRHKWIESEKNGCDIGFEAALFNWVTNHRVLWKEKKSDTGIVGSPGSSGIL